MLFPLRECAVAERGIPSNDFDERLKGLIDMKTYNVTVNGVTYAVQVEEVGGAYAPVAAPAPAAGGAAGSVVVKAPMPGNIMKVNVKPGQAVKKGEVLVVLEAMKMENDIPAPCDGVVASVNVQKGASVAANDVIATLN